MTSIGRRPFLRGLGALALAPSAFGACATLPATGAWLSAAGDADEGFGLAVVPTPRGRTHRIATGYRGHGVAQDPVRPWEVALFARRPGTEAAVLDLDARRVRARFEAGPNRAFQGHGFYTSDGQHLVTTEAHVETGEGILGVRDVDRLELVAEVATGGIGPHEAILLADGVAAVANGGLMTRPQTGRSVLNLDTMDPSLAYVSLEGGELLDQVRAPEEKGSLRHLDATERGEVVFGLQIQRAALDHADVLPLVGLHRRGESLRMFEGLETTATMDDYVGSVAVCAETRVAGCTSPRGDVATFWSLDSGRPIGLHRLFDASGIAHAPAQRAFVLSSSSGAVHVLNADDITPAETRLFDGVRWDNHLVAIPVGESE